MYSDIMGQSGIDYKGKSPHRATVHHDQGDVKARTGTLNNNAKGVKHDNLRSSLDNHQFEARLTREVEPSETPEKVDFKTITGK